ncbi:MAG: acyltransferase family protein, partial [Muribaculaceae bacterium]
MDKLESKKLLPEVSIVRPILIICIVIGHCFAPYSGAWDLPKNINGETLYSWINPLFISFQLQAFVFISGYLYSYQKKTSSNIQFIYKKFKRLIIPAIFFGIIYYLLFRFERDYFNISNAIIQILSGIGHLWFLPMLFWCFFIIRFLDKIIISNIIKLALLFPLTIIPVPIPFGIGVSLHYVFFFYCGIFVFTNKNSFDFILCKRKYIILFLFILFWSINFYLGNTIVPERNSLFIKLCFSLFAFFIGTFGTLLMYSITIEHTKARQDISKFIISGGKICFGV